MGGDGRVEDEGVNVTEGGCGLDELEGVHEGEDLFAARVLDGEGEDAARTASVARAVLVARAFAVRQGLQEGMLGMIGEARVVDVGDLGVGF